MAEKEYIEREKVENWLLTESASLDTEVDREYVVERLRSEIPAADVRPVVRGEWLRIPSDGKFRESCLCSVCKKSPPIESWVVQGFKACPYCFADMREES